MRWLWQVSKTAPASTDFLSRGSMTISPRVWDEEAIRLVEYQRAYQAAAKMVSVLDQLSETTINMIH